MPFFRFFAKCHVIFGHPFQNFKPYFSTYFQCLCPLFLLFTNFRAHFFGGYANFHVNVFHHFLNFKPFFVTIFKFQSTFFHQSLLLCPFFLSSFLFWSAFFLSVYLKLNFFQLLSNFCIFFIFPNFFWDFSEFLADFHFSCPPHAIHCQFFRPICAHFRLSHSNGCRLNLGF